MASRQTLSSSSVLAAAVRMPPDLEGVMTTVAGHLEPALPGGTVYTDDLSPVEWLTDLSIIRYATGAR